MELSEFISLAKANIESEYFSGECSIREHYAENYATVTKERDWQKRKTQIKVIANSMESDDFIWVQFETGGTSGGSCWDDSDPQDYHCDGEMPEFIGFYKLLELTVPTLGFLQVKLMEHDLIHSFDYTNYEYYGNCTNYDIKYAKLSDIYNWLVQKEFLK